MDERLIRLLAKPKYIPLAAEYLFDEEFSEGELETIGLLYEGRADSLFNPRSEVVAAYLLLKAFFERGFKALIVAPAYRLSKYEVLACTKLAESKTYRQLVGPAQRHQDVNSIRLRLGESEIAAIGVGVDGNPLRGYGPDVLVIKDVRAFVKENLDSIRLAASAAREVAWVSYYNAGVRSLDGKPIYPI